MGERSPSPILIEDVVEHVGSAELLKKVPVELSERSSAQYIPGQKSFEDLDAANMRYWNMRDKYEKMRDNAYEDELTGLKNRRALTRDIPMFAEHALYSGESYWVLALDGNGFKAINDTYGHSVGDQVLSTMGAAIRRSIYPGDEAYRTGGDEVVCILVASDDLSEEEMQQKLSERLNGVFAEMLTDHNLPADITMAAGLSRWEANSGQEWDEALEVADKNLYAAKNALNTGAKDIEPDQSAA